MATWGVIRLPDGSVSANFATGDGAAGAALAAHLDGVIALTHDASLSTALASLPGHVAVIVEVDAQEAVSGEPGALIATLIAALDDEHAAVVAARPMADALKQVEGDVIIGSLARDGLLAPCLPHVYRRDVLAEVLTGSDAEPLELLLAAGHAVRVIPADGSAVTVRGRG